MLDWHIKCSKRKYQNRTGGTEDQMVETERGEPKVTVYGGAGRKEIVGECSTGMVGGKQQI